jgi:hypothetical protein
MSLPSAVLRSSAIELMGSGLGSVSPARFFAAVDGLLQSAAPAGFRIATRTAPLSDIEAVWADDDSAGRLVLIVA